MPILIGVVAATITAYVTWMLVREDVTRSTGIGVAAGGELKFVFFFTAAAGIVASFVARRLLQGAPVARKEWLVTLPAMSPTATGYREGSWLTVADLLERLEARGYRLTAAAASPQVSFDPRTPLSAIAIRLTDERLGPAPGGLVLRLGERTHAGALGTVEAHDQRGEGYAELATFVIAELDALTPGVTYKPSDSALTPDPAEELRGVLPVAPRAIAGR